MEFGTKSPYCCFIITAVLLIEAIVGASPSYYSSTNGARSSRLLDDETARPQILLGELLLLPKE